MRLTLGGLRLVIREAAYAGIFKKGDHVLWGKYKNKKGKIVDVYIDDKGHPTIDIEPVPKGRKKTVTMGLYKIWKPENDFNEETLKESTGPKRGPWVVRAGSQVMVRRELDPIDSWRPHTTTKVLYFTDDDRLRGPSSSTAEQAWTFRDGDWLVVIRDEQFLTRPEWKFFPPRSRPKSPEPPPTPAVKVTQ